MRVPRSVVLFLAVGLIAASQSGNIIRLADAHPVAVAAWRLVIAAALLAPFGGRRFGSLAELTGRQWVLLVAAGLALASHFITWIAAVQHTTVANAAVFFSINPVFTATAAFLIFRERVGWPLLASIVLGIGGVAVIGVADLGLRPDYLTGDVLAVVCSVLFTAYFLLGKQLRRSLDNRVYVPVLYGIAGVATALLIPILGLPAVRYDEVTWLAFVLMALVPTMIGHTSMNLALRYIDAGRISVLTLSEPIFAGIVAYVAWDEDLTIQTLVGYVLICLSVILVVRDRPPSKGR